MINFGYGARSAHTPENQRYFSATWTQENVSSRGPLGALYRVWGDGKRMSKDDVTDHYGLTGFTSEQLRGMGYNPVIAPGEKGLLHKRGYPTFLNLLDNGLRGYQEGSWGGWGGRRRSDAAGGGRGAGPAGADVRGPGTPVGPDDPGIGRVSLQRGFGECPGTGTSRGRDKWTWRRPRPGIHRTGAGSWSRRRTRRTTDPSSHCARKRTVLRGCAAGFRRPHEWSVTPRFSDANHEPRVTIKGPFDISARPGATIRLEGKIFGSRPRSLDGELVADHHDAGTFPGDITFRNANAATTTFQIPNDAQPGQTVHVILRSPTEARPR